MVEDISRRNFIRNGSAGALAVGMAGLAGCTSSLPIIGDSSDGPAVGNWLTDFTLADVFDEDELADDYEESELEDDEVQSRSFGYVAPEEFLDNEEETDAYSALSSSSEFRSRVGVTASEIDWQLSYSTSWEYDFTYAEEDYYSGEKIEEEGSSRTNAVISTISGSFEPDGVEERLEEWAEDEYEYDDDEELSSEGNREGLDFYEVDGIGFAVGEDYVIQANGGTYIDPIAVLEATIDAYWNDDGRLVDDDDARELLDHVESGDSVSGSLFEPRTLENAFEDQYGDEYDGIDDLPDYLREDFEERNEYDDWESGLMGRVTTNEIDGETTDITTVFLYENERDADADALSDYVDANRNIGDRWETLEEYSVSDEGRVLILTGTARTRATF